MHTYDVEYTDTFGGEANYSWCRRATIFMPDLDASSDWDGSGRREPKGYQAMLMRKAKAAAGITGMRGTTYRHGEDIEFRPYRSCTVLWVSYKESE